MAKKRGNMYETAGVIGEKVKKYGIILISFAGPIIVKIWQGAVEKRKKHR